MIKTFTVNGDEITSDLVEISFVELVKVARARMNESRRAEPPFDSDFTVIRYGKDGHSMVFNDVVVLEDGMRFEVALTGVA